MGPKDWKHTMVLLHTKLGITTSFCPDNNKIRISWRIKTPICKLENWGGKKLKDGRHGVHLTLQVRMNLILWYCKTSTKKEEEETQQEVESYRQTTLSSQPGGRTQTVAILSLSSTPKLAGEQPEEHLRGFFKLSWSLLHGSKTWFDATVHLERLFPKGRTHLGLISL